MKFEIEIPVLVHTEETDLYRDLDIESKLSERNVENATFYRVDIITKHYDKLDNNKEYCLIHINGDCLTCPLTYNEVKKLIREQMNPS